MQSTILILILSVAFALFAWADWRAPGKAVSLKMLLLIIALLALVGLLGHWGLPIATDIISAVFGA